MQFVLKLPINWSGYLGFDPVLGSRGIMHVLFWSMYHYRYGKIRHYIDTVGKF